MATAMMSCPNCDDDAFIIKTHKPSQIAFIVGSQCDSCSYALAEEDLNGLITTETMKEVQHHLQQVKNTKSRHP
jgi:hypothetical protein